MNENLHRVIGIDLGTTYSAVAAWNKHNEQAVVLLNHIEDETEGRTTPSVISLDPVSGKAVVGMWAKRNREVDPDNTIIEIKREMGEEFRPDTLEKFAATKAYNVGEPVKVNFAGQWLMPQEISAFTLMRMKQVAEEEIGAPIYDAVVTVPAYFKEKQKKATREAALLAGLYPRQLIPEPTAAAICYCMDRQNEEKKTYLVYDLGGGTFDVSIIEMEGQNGEVIATSGDPRLGGGDFDDAITNWAVEQLRAHEDLDVRNNPRARAYIKYLAEFAKIVLSSANETKLVLTHLRPTKAPILTLTRQEFIKMIEVDEKYLSKSLNFVDTAIELAKAKKGIGRENIDAILLVGGSSKIPRVKELLLEYFQRREEFIRSDVNPDEVVARGAALLARKFMPSHSFDIKQQPDATLVSTEPDDLVVRLITEHSLGVRVQNDRFSRIIDQGTNIPVSVTEGGYTNGVAARDLVAQVYQGEGESIYDCTYIGEVHLGPFEPKPPGQLQFAVTFSLDINGLLTMTVHEKTTDKKWEARFDQKTSVGGMDALTLMRNKLVKMYAGTPQGPVTEVVPPSDALPRSPTSVSDSIPMPVQPAAVTPAQPVSPQSASNPMLDLVQTRVEVPVEFKQLVRRAQKQLEKCYSLELVQAFNAFTTALNAGVSGEQLEDLGDELANAHEDARRQAP